MFEFGVFIVQLSCVFLKVQVFYHKSKVLSQKNHTNRQGLATENYMNLRGCRVELKKCKKVLQRLKVSTSGNLLVFDLLSNRVRVLWGGI